MNITLVLRLLLPALLLAAGIAAEAQTSALRGRVTDKETGDPLPGVSV